VHLYRPCDRPPPAVRGRVAAWTTPPSQERFPVRASTPAPATPPTATSSRRRRTVWHIAIRLFTLERIPRAGGMPRRLSDKRSRVISDSRRTLVLYSQLLMFGTGCGSERSLTDEKKADKTGHDFGPPNGLSTDRTEANPVPHQPLHRGPDDDYRLAYLA